MTDDSKVDLNGLKMSFTLISFAHVSHFSYKRESLRLLIILSTLKNFRGIFLGEKHVL